MDTINDFLAQCERSGLDLDLGPFLDTEISQTVFEAVPFMFGWSAQEHILRLVEGVVRLHDYMSHFGLRALVCIGESPSKPGYVMKRLFGPDVSVYVFPFSYNKTLAVMENYSAAQTGQRETLIDQLKDPAHEYLEEHLGYVYRDRDADEILFLDFMSFEHKTFDVLLSFLSKTGRAPPGIDGEIEEIKGRVHAVESDPGLPTTRRHLMSTHEVFGRLTAKWLDKGRTRCLEGVNLLTRKPLSAKTLSEHWDGAVFHRAECVFLVNVACLCAMASPTPSPSTQKGLPDLDPVTVYEVVVYSREAFRFVTKRVLMGVLHNTRLHDPMGADYGGAFVFRISETEDRVGPVYPLLNPPATVEHTNIVRTHPDNPWVYEVINVKLGTVDASFGVLVGSEEKILLKFDRALHTYYVEAFDLHGFLKSLKTECAHLVTVSRTDDTEVTGTIHKCTNVRLLNRDLLILLTEERTLLPMAVNHIRAITVLGSRPHGSSSDSSTLRPGRYTVFAREPWVFDLTTSVEMFSQQPWIRIPGTETLISDFWIVDREMHERTRYPERDE